MPSPAGESKNGRREERYDRPANERAILSRHEILAVVPVSGCDPEFSHGLPRLAGRSLLDYTFDAIRGSRLIRRAVIATDSAAIAREGRRAGLEVPFLRSPRSRHKPIGQVLDDVVARLERADPTYRPSWIVQLHVTYPFREPGFVDRAIRTVLRQDVDSAFVVFPEYEAFWQLGPGGRPVLVTTDLSIPRSRRTPIYRQLGGLFSMVSRGVLRKGVVHGARVGIIPVRSPLAPIDIHGTQGLALARLVAQLKSPGTSRRQTAGR